MAGFPVTLQARPHLLVRYFELEGDASLGVAPCPQFKHFGPCRYFDVCVAAARIATRPRGQATPHTKLFAGLQRLLHALNSDRTGRAHGFGVAGILPAFRVEEGRLHAPAGGVLYPGGSWCPDARKELVEIVGLRVGGHNTPPAAKSSTP